MVKRYQTGGVSVFIVIFTALLLTVVTTSFVQLMIRNQQQATNNDLSQSAYDAALAGVEDAKRALVRLSECGRSTTPECVNLRNVFSQDSDECEFLGSPSVGVASFTNGEVGVGDPSLNQAYTCVKVQLNSQDMIGELGANTGAEVLGLRALNDAPIDKVRISWYTSEDLANPQASLISADPFFKRLPQANTNQWTRQTPSIIRAQLIQFRKGSISLDSFSSPNTTNALTAFLYPDVELFSDGNPTQPPTNGSPLWANDTRLNDKSDENIPRPVECDQDNDASYYCSVTISLPNPEGGNRTNREAYLQLASLYNATHFKVELLNNNNDILPFEGQQAIVDSTGRASALFRRVSARVSVKTPPLSFPDAALSIEGNLCKNFAVTSSKSEYASLCSAQ